MRLALLAAVTLATFATPPTEAQETAPRPRRIGFLFSGRRAAVDKGTPRVARLLGRLDELGYREGKNVSFEWRYAEDDYAKLPALAEDLVKGGVDVILTAGTEGIRAAQGATKTVPIVFVGGTDVVAQGLVKSLGHPGGNTTGITALYGDIVGKQVELLRTLVPKVSRVAVFYNPTNPANREHVSLYRAAVRASGVEIVPIAVPAGSSLEDGFARVNEARVHAMIWALDNYLLTHQSRIAQLAAKQRIPCMGGTFDYPDAGGLIAYGPNQIATWARLGEFVARILEGANPGDLPVEQPTKLELVINRRVASALGLTIPAELLVVADRVIE